MGTIRRRNSGAAPPAPATPSTAPSSPDAGPAISGLPARAGRPQEEVHLPLGDVRQQSIHQRSGEHVVGHANRGGHVGEMGLTAAGSAASIRP